MGNYYNVEVTASLLYARGRSGYGVPVRLDLPVGKPRRIAVHREPSSRK